MSSHSLIRMCYGTVSNRVRVIDAARARLLGGTLALTNRVLVGDRQARVVLASERQAATKGVIPLRAGACLSAIQALHPGAGAAQASRRHRSLARRRAAPADSRGRREPHWSRTRPSVGARHHAAARDADLMAGVQLQPSRQLSVHLRIATAADGCRSSSVMR